MTVCLFPGLDVGDVPPTPSTPHGVEVVEAHSVLFEYASQYGYPIGYAQEQNGRMFQNIVPVHKTEFDQISTSSKVELGLHTETAFHPYKPDYVLLLCLRGDAAAFTTYANLRDILKRLDKVTKNILRKPWYNTRIDQSFRSNGENDKTFTIPVLYGREDHTSSMVYDKIFMEGINSPARIALQTLDEVIQQCTRKIALNTGDLLVINNRNTIHGRLPFQPRYDGTDRWLIRSMVVSQLPPPTDVEGHVITTVL